MFHCIGRTQCPLSCCAECPLSGESGHHSDTRQCLLLTQSGHHSDTRQCLLLTQSGHGPAYKSRVNHWALVQLTCLSSSITSLRSTNAASKMNTYDAVPATHELALALLLRSASGRKGRCDMYRCVTFENSLQSRLRWAWSPMQAGNQHLRKSAIWLTRRGQPQFMSAISRRTNTVPSPSYRTNLQCTAPA